HARRFVQRPHPFDWLRQTCFPTFHALCTISFIDRPVTTRSPPLSLHDALPISPSAGRPRWSRPSRPTSRTLRRKGRAGWPRPTRSEEHTSELQSPYDIVCRLLLERKKTIHHRAGRTRLLH